MHRIQKLLLSYEEINLQLKITLLRGKLLKPVSLLTGIYSAQNNLTYTFILQCVAQIKALNTINRLQRVFNYTKCSSYNLVYKRLTHHSISKAMPRLSIVITFKLQGVLSMSYDVEIIHTFGTMT